ARIAALFGGFGLEYQAISAQVAAYHQRFVQALSTGAGAYASAAPAAWVAPTAPSRGNRAKEARPTAVKAALAVAARAVPAVTVVPGVRR
ncbi:PE family protein, partial [Mycobacterium tuberculosis]|uniref:PE family protein n=1 Tax=Mycobacterium tuberculosis TaxID=1773 RepID=UPI001784234C